MSRWIEKLSGLLVITGFLGGCSLEYQFATGEDSIGDDDPPAHFTQFGSTVANRTWVISRIEDLVVDPQNSSTLGQFRYIADESPYSSDSLRLTGANGIRIFGAGDVPAADVKSRSYRDLSQVSRFYTPSSLTEGHMTSACYQLFGAYPTQFYVNSQEGNPFQVPLSVGSPSCPYSEVDRDLGIGDYICQSGAPQYCYSYYSNYVVDEFYNYTPTGSYAHTLTYCVSAEYSFQPRVLLRAAIRKIGVPVELEPDSTLPYPNSENLTAIHRFFHAEEPTKAVATAIGKFSSTAPTRGLTAEEAWAHAFFTNCASPSWRTVR